MSEPSFASEFDPCQTSDPEVLIQERSGWTKVSRDEPKFCIFDGFHEISVLAPVIGLLFFTNRDPHPGDVFERLIDALELKI